MVPFILMGTVSYLHSIATIAVSLAISTPYTDVTDTQPDRHCTTSICVALHGNKIITASTLVKSIMKPSFHLQQKKAHNSYQTCKNTNRFSE